MLTLLAARRVHFYYDFLVNENKNSSLVPAPAEPPGPAVIWAIVQREERSNP